MSDISEQKTEEKKDPIPLDPMMVQIGEFLQKHIENSGLSFEVQGREVSPAELSSPSGLLSIIVFYAGMFYQDLMKRPAPLYYYQNSDSICSVSPGTDNTPHNTFTIWAHFIHFSLEQWSLKYPNQLKDKTSIPLDDLYTQWYDAAQRQEITFKHPPKPQNTPKHGQGQGKF